jgi:hypothetical protein
VAQLSAELLAARSDAAAARAAAAAQARALRALRESVDDASEGLAWAHAEAGRANKRAQSARRQAAGAAAAAAADRVRSAQELERLREELENDRVRERRRRRRRQGDEQARRAHAEAVAQLEEEEEEEDADAALKQAFLLAANPPNLPPLNPAQKRAEAKAAQAARKAQAQADKAAKKAEKKTTSPSKGLGFARFTRAKKPKAALSAPSPPLEYGLHRPSPPPGTTAAGPPPSAPAASVASAASAARLLDPPAAVAVVAAHQLELSSLCHACLHAEEPLADASLADALAQHLEAYAADLARVADEEHAAQAHDRSTGGDTGGDTGVAATAARWRREAAALPKHLPEPEHVEVLGLQRVLDAHCARVLAWCRVELSAGAPPPGPAFRDELALLLEQYGAELAAAVHAEMAAEEAALLAELEAEMAAGIIGS